ncbi:MAG: hypothetical protein ACRDTA_25470 [Pseudonocardiaceae bacterium]
MNPSQEAGPVSAAQVERAPEVLDGELITEAEYAQRRSLPLLAVMAAIRESDHPKKITTAVVSGVARCTRVAARACFTVGQGHASWARRALDALTYGPVREQIRLARQAGDGNHWPNGPNGWWRSKTAGLSGSGRFRPRWSPGCGHCG